MRRRICRDAWLGGLLESVVFECGICVQPKPETGELWHVFDMYNDNMLLTFVVEDASADASRHIEAYTQETNLAEVEGDRYLTVLDDGYAWEIAMNTSSNEGAGIGTEYEAWDSWV